MSDNSSAYNYDTEDGFPTLSATVTFTVFFALFTAAHIIQAGWKKQFWLYGTIVIFGLLEVIGWAARCTHARTGYIIQTSLLVISPCFLTAFIYYDLKHVIHLYGPKYSLLPAKTAGWLFIVIDIICILIQAAGGGIAASASSGNSDDPEESADTMKLGSHIVLAGIILQLVTVFVYSCFLAEFCFRYYTNKAARSTYTTAAVIRLSSREQLKLKLRLGMLSTISVLVLWRSAFRVAELNGGWEGELMQNQDAFDANDGVPMLLSLIVCSFLHIGWLNPEKEMIRSKQDSYTSTEDKHELV
ncbi:RTA1-domain-containing protein [Wallemia mellicola]|uniref:RTA1-domain-containing protein n=1 Tax=Wallemia mellicola TaxID=1708541 RepID=A0A4T0Q2A4_9BASI|nr:RTA1-domain-containing protein [Wallemia mellicola]TIC17128.1 RTA1-domain-containing protein [Wallemia mellicola]TIC56997.1 RTA1-domain-containing protein [Wallemia mellicola]TIC65703.1 RTA1-domain-containing protein [Wallemia mellicola]